MTKKEHILNILEQFEKCDLSDSSNKKIKKVKIQTKKTNALPETNYFLKKMLFFLFIF